MSLLCDLLEGDPYMTLFLKEGHPFSFFFFLDEKSKRSSQVKMF
jgi:hypothetical protein